MNLNLDPIITKAPSWDRSIKEQRRFNFWMIMVAIGIAIAVAIPVIIGME